MDLPLRVPRLLLLLLPLVALAVLAAVSPAYAKDFSPYGGLLSEGQTFVVVPGNTVDKPGDADIVPVDSISLHFGELTFEYKEQSDKDHLDGDVEATWSVSDNAGKK